MFSKVSTKGQVAIPAEIPIKTLKQLRGSVATSGSGVFVKEREEAKRTVAERVTGETA